MKSNQIYKISSLALLFLGLISTQNGISIPAFARKYQISCQVCHAPAIPRLKAFGETFAANGFRMTNYESPRYFIQTGDEKLSLLRELPLAIRMDGFVSYNFNDEGAADFEAPFVLKILTGGEISEKLSYYFYFLFNERGSIAGVEDAFLMYHDLFKTGVNFYIGQFQASDPLFKGELRYTLEPYVIYGVKPGNSLADLKYDRGIILEKDFKTGTTVVGEVLNGCGIGAAGEEALFDNDKYKNLMLRVNQAIGKNLSIGIFGYAGKEFLADTWTGTSTGVNNLIRMIGPDLSIDFDNRFILNVQYVRRTDSQVYDGLFVEEDVMTQGGFAEITYSPKGDMSKWYLTGLFNWVDSDLEELNYQAATFHAGYLLRRNLRVVAEYTQQLSGTSYGRVNAGFVAAF
jgi:hypothetical protein